MTAQIVPYQNSNRQPLQFDFNGNPLTANIDESSEPRFIASDVCKILEISNIAQAVARLDDDEKGLTTVYTLGGSQDVLTVNESGLYSLVLTSRKKEAKAFKRWITHEVLPALRKTGSYALQAMSPAEIILMQAQKLVDLERAQDQQRRELRELHELQAGQAMTIEAVVERLDDADYYTVRQWCIKQRIKYTPSILSMWGRAASELSSARNIERKEAIEGPYPVGRYHISVLREVCVAKPKSHGQLTLTGTGS